MYSQLRSYPTSDIFFTQVYRYYINRGYTNTVLSHVYAIGQIIYVMGLFIFLGCYVDYSVTGDFSEMLKYQRPSFLQGVFIFVFCVYIIGAIVRAWTDIKHVRDVSHLYTNALEIDDSTICEMSWDDVVYKLLKLECYNSLTEVDVTSCIMRRDNYLIALKNMDVLKIHFNLLGDSLLSTKSLEWIVNVALFNFYCNDSGQIKEENIYTPDRDKTYRKFERWIQTLTIISVIFAPFIWMYLSVYVILRYAQDVKIQPSILSSRKWSNDAMWSFREYNELSHYFKRRISKSFVFANMYVNSFHNTSMVNLCQFLTFLFGSATTILVWFSLIDIELMWGRSILWWIGVFGSLTALVRSGIPSSDISVDSKQYLHHVAHFTHYMPSDWENKETSESVQRKMAGMFELKPVNVLRELLSILCIPYILHYHIKPKSDEIVNFFIQYTTPYLIDGENDIHGGVCTFASFNQKTVARSVEQSSDNVKMQQSILTFNDNHKQWKPSNDNEVFMSLIIDDKSVQRSSDESVMFEAIRDDSVIDLVTASQVLEKHPELQSSVLNNQRYFFKR